MRLRQTIPAPVVTRASSSQNTAKTSSFSFPQPFINIACQAEINVLASGGGVAGYGGPRDPATWLPTEIPAGQDALSLFFAWGGGKVVTGDPVVGRYAIRHNLPDTYSFSAPNIVSTSAGRVVFDLPESPGNWQIDITGPTGPLPSGWSVEILLEAHEPLFDSTVIPEAERVWSPALLSIYTAMNPSEIRMMNLVDINNDLTTVEVSDYPPDSAIWFRRSARLKDLVALCEYFNATCWFNVHTNASDMLIQHFARYIRDNLSTSLRVLVEFGNENWNNSFDQYLDSAGTGMKFLGTEAPGTVTILKDSNLITATGFDLAAIIGTGGLSQANKFIIGDHAYFVDRAAVTSTQATLKGNNVSHKDQIDQKLYFNSNSAAEYQNHGYLMDAVNVMRIWRDVFTATGQETRLTCVLGTHTANTNVTDVFINDGFWNQEPGYIPTKDAFDVLAVTTYFFAQFDTATVAALWDAGDTQGWRDHFSNGSLNDIHGRIAQRLRNQRSRADQLGLKMIAYEGGDHSVHTGTVPNRTDTGNLKVLAAYEDWLFSDDAIPVWEAWRDLHVRFLDGPVSNYRISDNWGNFGFFGTYRSALEAEYSRIQVLKQDIGADPWWLPDYAPRWAAIPAQTLSAGETLDLADWCSVNALSFSGALPVGATLVDGVLTAGATASGPQDYSFTAANGAGSAATVVRIEIT